MRDFTGKKVLRGKVSSPANHLSWDMKSRGGGRLAESRTAAALSLDFGGKCNPWPNPAMKKV
jgi:hypothetical protein